MTKPSRSVSNAREAVVGSALYLVESADIASNIAAVRQPPDSPAPQKQMSCLPSARGGEGEREGRGRRV